MSSEKYTLVEGGLTITTKLSDTDDTPYELFVDTTVAGKQDTQQEREDKAESILMLLDESNIANEWHEGYAPADLEVLIGFEQHGYGVYGMIATMDWPPVSDRIATLIATRAMQGMALDLGYTDERMLKGMVYAQIERASGMSFETNPAAAASMDTDGNEYDPTEARVTLHAHNLYSHQMQLICLSGIIAVAKAGGEEVSSIADGNPLQ